MDTNKHELAKRAILTAFFVQKVVVSTLEHTTQNSLQMLKTEPLRILKNALWCISCLSWLKIICVHWCPFVVPNFLCLPCIQWLKQEV